MPLLGRGRFGETRFGGTSRFIDVAGLAGGSYDLEVTAEWLSKE